MRIPAYDMNRQPLGRNDIVRVEGKANYTAEVLESRQLSIQAPVEVMVQFTITEDLTPIRWVAASSVTKVSVYA